MAARNPTDYKIALLRIGYLLGYNGLCGRDPLVLNQPENKKLQKLTTSIYKEIISPENSYDPDKIIDDSAERHSEKIKEYAQYMSVKGVILLTEDQLCYAVKEKYLANEREIQFRKTVEEINDAVQEDLKKKPAIFSKTWFEQIGNIFKKEKPEVVYPVPRQKSFSHAA